MIINLLIPKKNNVSTLFQPSKIFSFISFHTMMVILFKIAKCQFKFIIQMRKKGNLLKSARTRTRTSSMNDLVTQTEQTLSSQASIYTNASKNSQRTNSQMAHQSAHSQNFDDYEDIIGEDIDTLFITPQEEKKIQNILEFARKGKINPGNAFQIPVRVIDPQLTESTNMRFWKFASELLYASMSVYDKRVENMYLTTNRMFDNLLRVQGEPNRPLTEQEVEQKHRKQRGQLIQMDVGDIGKVKTLSSYEIGSANCQEADKINIKNLRNQFLPDPLFQKRLQAFDSNTLKSLFMNVFESGKNLQVEFFNERKESPEVKIQVEQKIQEKIEQQMEQFQERIPKFVFSELQNFSTNFLVSPVFNQMDVFRKEQFRGTIQNTRFQVKDFVQELKQFNKFFTQSSSLNGIAHNNNDSEATQANSILSFQRDSELNFQFNSQDHTQLSQSYNHPESQSMPNTVAYSARPSPTSQFYDEDDENFTSMTPWQLEFKGMKLQKRVVHRSDNQRQKRGPKVSQPQPQVNFFDGKKQLRSKIFMGTIGKFSKQECQVDTNLLPLSMNPFVQALKKRKFQQKSDYFLANRHKAPFLPQATDFHQQSNLQNQLSNQNQGQSDDNIINLDEHYEAEEETLTQRATNFDSNLIQHQHESQGVVYRSIGIRNIREIKEKIFKRILEGRSVRLSELNINIAPSSVLIIFLHLVNENNINIISLEDEHDLEISPRVQ